MKKKKKKLKKKKEKKKNSIKIELQNLRILFLNIRHCIAVISSDSLRNIICSAGPF